LECDDANGSALPEAKKRRDGSVEEDGNCWYSAFRSGLGNFGQLPWSQYRPYVMLLQKILETNRLLSTLPDRLNLGSQEERWKR
jgi:hypothetical protein